jgi:sulfate permease, SulP family
MGSAPGRRGVARCARDEITGDVLAGISVAMVGIPQALAYAQLAGMPPIRGLYATAIPPLVAALFASSPYLQTGPVAITSVLTFGALTAHASPGSDEYVQLGLLLALVVGVTRIALGLLRAGVLAYLMSQPMLIGFVPAAAILIAAAQLPNVLGSAAPNGDPIEQAAWALGRPGTWSAAAVGLSAVVLAVIFAGRRLHALFPGVLIATLVGLAATSVLGYGGAIVGDIPSALPPLSADLPWGSLPEVLLPGAIIALVGFTEAASIARRFASEDRSRWSADQEFVSQGAANVSAAFTGGMPCGGSFSRSSVNRMSGARTRRAGAITGLTVLVFLPFAAVLEPLPLAVLGAIVIAAVVGLVRLRPLISLGRYSRPQCLVAGATFAATLAFSPRIERAVLVGIGLSLVVFLWRMLHFDVDVERSADTLVLRPRGVLWFATAQKLDSSFLDAVAEAPEARRLTLDLSRLGRIDTTGALALGTLIDHARSAGLEPHVENIPPQSRGLTEPLLAAHDPLG